jgi:hypothetical protein
VAGCPKGAIGRMPLPVTPHHGTVDSASHPARHPSDGNLAVAVEVRVAPTVACATSPSALSVVRASTSMNRPAFGRVLVEASISRALIADAATPSPDCVVRAPTRCPTSAGRGATGRL